LAAWGRGQDARKAAPELERLVTEHGQDSLWQGSLDTLPDVAEALENFKTSQPSVSKLSLAALAMIARRLPDKLSDSDLAEVVLQADELALEEGQRTILQERMLEVLADFAGLQFFEAESESAEGSEIVQAEEIESADLEYIDTPQSEDSFIDLNTASFETLQSLPHIGPGRAEAIIERRPWSNVDELQKIDGIGPQRLEEIREQAVVGKIN
jgi:hypothetical protein